MTTLTPSSAGSVDDPGAAVEQEVERGVKALTEQHNIWLELCASGVRGGELDWRTAELLSCLRALEWDLQDLEDALSIVEGNREKFCELDDAAVRGRREFIDTVRAKIDGVRASVQAATSDGHATAKKKGPPSSLAAAKGYGKLREQRESDVGGGGGGACGASEAASGLERQGSGGGGGELPPADEGGAPAGRRRPWWLCCC